MDILYTYDKDEDVRIKTTAIDPTRIYDADYLGIEEDKPKKKKLASSSKDFDLEKFEIDMGWKSSNVSFDPSKELTHLIRQVKPLDEILKLSVITSGFEKLHVVPPYELSKHQLKVQKQREKRKMGAGAGWFNMRAPKITPEISRDLKILRMRSVLDPKRFYKKNDMKALPKHFHVGKVVDSPIDFYSSRLTKRERRKTTVEELMADAEFMKYNKRKYKEVIEEKKKTHYKAHRHAKRLKEKKKK